MSKRTIANLPIRNRISMGVERTTLEGLRREDRNIHGNSVIIQSDHCTYSLADADILSVEKLDGGHSRMKVRNGARAFRTERVILWDDIDSPEVDMENRRPPAPTIIKGMPKKGVAMRIRSLAGESGLAAVAKTFNNKCVGGDRYENNCAHFLSDAFIRAGFSELDPPNPYIEERCSTSAKRPIRARNMWEWFKSKATSTGRELKKNTGWWAVFQLDEAKYWGGHVAVFDSDTWTYYGTGWYDKWDQYLYKW